MNAQIVIAGAAQMTSHWTPNDGVDAAPSPHSLCVTVGRQALDGLGSVDVLAVVRTTEDSVPTSTYAHGRNPNLPGTIARDLGLNTRERIYHHVGGQSPQELVNEMAGRIAAGYIDSALIVGAEATAAAKAATRAGLTLDWTDDEDAPFTDRGASLDWIHPDELRHGLITATLFYGIFENRLAHKRRETRGAHQVAMAELFAPFSEVAAANPHAQFPTKHSTEFLSTPSAKNFPVADPFLKWHVAQDGVNQGAAILLLSAGKADELGRKSRTYLIGGGEAQDTLISERESLHRSAAMDAAVSMALDLTGATETGLDVYDIYSCFPVAVWSGWEALGRTRMPPYDRPLTITGGLPFFGGPGNNYSLHAIAEMHARLNGRDASGLVLANGGWMSKEAVGIYSGTPRDFVPVPSPTRITARRDICRDDCSGVIESFTFAHNRDGSPRPATVFVRLPDGRRALAVAKGEALSKLANDTPMIDAPVTVSVSNGVGTLSLAN